MIVTVFDYGAGNLHSLAKALAEGGDVVRIEADPRAALDTQALVLPGVGAFASAARRLAPGREAMRDAIARGLPCLGICLGMQLLFDSSEEGPGDGLGLIPGRVTRLQAARVPHIGWNTLERPPAPDTPFARAPLGFVYYAHGFACRPADARHAIAWTTHEDDRFAAAVRRGAALGVQFHPEKSSRAGVAFLRAWLDDTRASLAAATSLATCSDVSLAAAGPTLATPGTGSLGSSRHSVAGPGAMPCS